MHHKPEGNYMPHPASTFLEPFEKDMHLRSHCEVVHLHSWIWFGFPNILPTIFVICWLSAQCKLRQSIHTIYLSRSTVISKLDSCWRWRLGRARVLVAVGSGSPRWLVLILAVRACALSVAGCLLLLTCAAYSRASACAVGWSPSPCVLSSLPFSCVGERLVKYYYRSYRTYNVLELYFSSESPLIYILENHRSIVKLCIDKKDVMQVWCNYS